MTDHSIRDPSEEHGKSSLLNMRRFLSRTSLVLFAIVVAGIFLRSYHFREWLHFGSDQARDLILVERVVSGKAPIPLLGMEAGNTRFDLGPAHYYFQILSAKIFGATPESMAYPDLFFSILAIPVMFLLFRKLFDEPLSLVLTALYAISFYGVEYSRFAWNPNAIPFFVGLFLLALSEFLESNEKTKWRWIFALGIAIGIGVQLHTILLFLFPVIFFGLALIFLRKNLGTFLRIVSVVAIALALNAPQVINEVQTQGKNTKLFLKSFTDRSESGVSRSLENAETDALCHSQANSHMVWALGHHGNCDFLSLIEHPERFPGTRDMVISYAGIFFSIVFSLVGYGLLFFFALKESDPRRRRFSILLSAYAILSFLILFPVIKGAPLRYFIHTTPIPFVLFGFVLVQIRRCYPRFGWVLAVLLILSSAFLNMRAITMESVQLASGMRGDAGFVVLGEAERMVAYMKERALPSSEVNFSGGTAYLPIYYKPLKYLASKEELDIHLAKRDRLPVSNVPLFFIYSSSDLSSALGKSFIPSGYEMLDRRDFGQISISQLQSVSIHNGKN